MGATKIKVQLGRCSVLLQGWAWTSSIFSSHTGRIQQFTRLVPRMLALSCKLVWLHVMALQPLRHRNLKAWVCLGQCMAFFFFLICVPSYKMVLGSFNTTAALGTESLETLTSDK